MSFVKKSAMAFVLALGLSAVAHADDMIGTLTAKPDGAAADVSAVLHTKKKGEEKTYNLVASGEQAKEIGEFLKSKKKVKVTGDVTGENVKVTAVAAAPVMEKKKKDAK